MFHVILHFPKSTTALCISKFRANGWTQGLNFCWDRTKPFIPRLLSTTTGSSSDKRDFDNSKEIPTYKQDIIDATKKWVDLIVVGEELCPFVAPLLEANSIRYITSEATSVEQAIEEFAGEARLLLKGYKKVNPKRTKHLDDTEGLIVHQSPANSDKSTTHGATLISFHGPFVKDFNDFDVLCEQINHNVVIEMKFFDILTVMNFHPNYISYYNIRLKKFNESFYYPRRSPYPTMLLIPDRDMQSALETEYIEELCDMNKARFIDQGLKKCHKRLESCYEKTSKK